MKIRIITIHQIPNFGSALQSYALCRYLQRQGYTDTALIDYAPSYFFSLRTRIGQALNFKAYRTRTKKFQAFHQANTPLTEKRFTRLSQLQRYAFDADVYIAGGDQLWNVYYPAGRDPAYRLAFTAGKKISYGTSMGQSQFPEEELSALAKTLEEFSAVSVREEASARQLREKGIPAVQSVDPVFLLPPEAYQKFIHPVPQPRYLLVYLVTASPLLEKTIAYLAKTYRLKVILCSGFTCKCTCDAFLRDLGPEEILSYIAQAEIVLSSSFHATAFSVMLKKQFFTILPDQHTNERIEDFLAKRGLSHRIITEKAYREDALRQTIDYAALPDYTPVIRQSQQYLLKALTQ